jgi:NADH:ubiquinone oxidoreductase subunit 5 (subunit L)/multisubunit Na+/H+ antiporter MnhA subunit
MIAVFGLGAAFMLYGKRTQTDPLAAKLGSFYTVLKNKFYFDIVYGWYVDHVQQNIALYLEQLEKFLLDRLCVGGLTNMARDCGKIFRSLQNGLVQFYALTFVLGAVLLFLILGKTL